MNEKAQRRISKSLCALLLLAAIHFAAALIAPPAALAARLRIISLTPSTTEMLFAIGAGPQIVGVTTADDYPPAVKNLPKVGGVELNEEKILAMKPDLVVGESDLAGASLARMKRLGLKILALHTRTLSDVPESLEILGGATGHIAPAEKLAASFNAAVASVERRAKAEPRPRVFVELGSRPLLTSGRGTFLSDLISDAGGKNVASDLPKGFQMISPERVVAADPQIIFTADGEGWRDLAKRSGWGSVSAVENEKVYAIDPDLIERPGPRSIIALEKIAAWIRKR